MLSQFAVLEWKTYKETWLTLEFRDNSFNIYRDLPEVSTIETVRNKERTWKSLRSRCEKNYCSKDIPRRMKRDGIAVKECCWVCSR